MTLTINSSKELLEIIKRDSISKDLASRITCEYLRVLDLTTSKEILIREVQKIADNTDPNVQFFLLLDCHNLDCDNLDNSP
jgi:hypothetical protein